jgi:hypothetical protein
MRNALSLALALAVVAVVAPSVAEETPYTEGTVMHMTFVRTKAGGYDAYMKFLSTQWKGLMEAAKKDGLIVSYRVVGGPARDRQDWDLMLVAEYKNMAALDGLDAKFRALIEKMVGSSAKAEEQAGQREEIREVLGEKLGRELILK